MKAKRIKIALLACLQCMAVTALAGEEPPAGCDNDYPTAARAEYVFGCMAANGQTPEMLAKCSCSIDVIASMLPYEKYVQAETVLAVQQDEGPRGSMYRNSPWAAAAVANLKQARAESTLRCF